LLKNFLDCHGKVTAAATAYRAEKLEMNTDPPLRFVTELLQVNYLLPTPLDISLEICEKVKEIKERKVIVEATLSANGKVCARGQVIAVQMPENMLKTGIT
jgi:acyl-CoA thioesterase FadM